MKSYLLFLLFTGKCRFRNQSLKAFKFSFQRSQGLFPKNFLIFRLGYLENEKNILDTLILQKKTQIIMYTMHNATSTHQGFHLFGYEYEWFPEVPISVARCATFCDGTWCYILPPVTTEFAARASNAAQMQFCNFPLGKQCAARCTNECLIHWYFWCQSKDTSFHFYFFFSIIIIDELSEGSFPVF